MLVYLLLSALFVNGVHGYLLWSQRHERKWSISVHAARDRQTYLLYLFCHIFGGLFFLLFAIHLFLVLHNIKWLFALALLGIIFEYIQAVLPGKGATEKAHAIMAYGMFCTYLIVVLLSEIVLPMNTLFKIITAPFRLAVFVAGYIAYKNRNKIHGYDFFSYG